MPSVSFLHSLNSIKHHTGADPNLPDCNGHTPQLLWQKASPSPISAPSSPSSPSSERIPRTPTTPQYAALDWSHHSGEGECRGAPSVQHTTLRPDSPEVIVADESFFLQNCSHSNIRGSRLLRLFARQKKRRKVGKNCWVPQPLQH